MLVWPRFSKRRCKNSVSCHFTVTGYRTGELPHRVEIVFRDDEENRLRVDMSIPEANGLARSLLSAWSENGYPKELMNPTPVEIMADALREALAWMPGGNYTPAYRGAKCETLNEARDLIAKALGE